MFREKMLFTNDLANPETGLRELINFSSVSDKDAERRIVEYSKMFENQEAIRSLKKSFSSYGDNEILANQYYNATVIGLAKSIVGYVAMERTLEQPEGLFYWYDLLNIAGDTILANVGKDNIGAYSNRINTSIPVVAAEVNYPINLLKKLIPGSVKLEVVQGTTIIHRISDNKNGLLEAAGGVLASGSTVNYQTGTITVKFAAGVPANGMSLRLQAVHDQIATANVNRFKQKLRSFPMNAFPEVLIGETDLPSLAAANKSLSIDPAELMTGSLRELYTKLVNAECVNNIVLPYQGDTHEIQISAWDDYRSKLDQFTGELQEVDTLLMKKTDKGVKATAYIVGSKGLNLMKQTKAIGMYKEAPQDYINDLTGYFDNIPVIHHENCPDDEIYAIHKTKGGEVAPVGRGLYLPLTDTPVVGNYENPVQQAQGVFYQHTTENVLPQLVQKVKLT